MTRICDRSSRTNHHCRSILVAIRFRRFFSFLIHFKVTIKLEQSGPRRSSGPALVLGGSVCEARSHCGRDIRQRHRPLSFPGVVFELLSLQHIPLASFEGTPPHPTIGMAEWT